MIQKRAKFSDYYTQTGCVIEYKESNHSEIKQQNVLKFPDFPRSPCFHGNPSQ